MRWTYATLLISVLLLAACTAPPPVTEQVVLPAAPQGAPAEPQGDPDEPTDPADTAPPATEAPGPAAEGPYPAGPAAALEGEAAYPAPEQSMFADNPMTFLADDGLEIVGTFTTPETPSPWPTVILLHMLGGQRTDYDAQISRFTAEGYAVLALDMRGHGDTGGEPDWDLAAEDLKMVAETLLNQPEIRTDGLAILGASIGSNMALKTGAAVPAVKSVVMLSPGLDYRGVTTEDALAAYGDRPLLIAASSEDSYAAESSQTLADTATGLVNFKLYEGAGHGTRMFGAEPGLMDLILAHLNQYVR